MLILQCHHLIANKNIYNPDPESLMKMVGIIKSKELYYVIKAVKDIHSKYKNKSR
ncbi:MAG: hypothetical protein LBT10_07030 [Methanobrevibacter sp.]|jgi:hypothetical protein|nr:hypothetical protein [Methanobrevibacter sp.]